MKRIGIVGGGQLGRMLAQAAHKLGFNVTVLDPTPRSPAGQVADKQIVGSFKDPEAIRALAKEVDYMTFEIESADAATLAELQKEGKHIHPSPQTLTIIKDKFGQKEFLKQAGIAVADALLISDRTAFDGALAEFGLPLLLKTRFDAYDGRGNALIRAHEDIEGAFKKLGENKLYVEKFVPFVKEISVVASRGSNGEVKVYPVVETIHKNNICHQVIAPASIDAEIESKARNLAAKAMNALEGVGVFGIEMFVTNEGDVLVNEIAPRVHNSGHHTIEACATSQFEQHIRALTGMPLGDTDLVVPAAVMVNILGERSGPAEIGGMENLDGRNDVHVHVYGKLETRPERKMGHITATADSTDEAFKKAVEARNFITI